MITREQSRAARALLDWTQSKLASDSSVGLSTIKDFEKGHRKPQSKNMSAIQDTLESSGIEFIPENGGGAGVRLKSSK